MICENCERIIKNPFDRTVDDAEKHFCSNCNALLCSECIELEECQICKGATSGVTN